MYISLIFSSSWLYVTQAVTTQGFDRHGWGISNVLGYPIPAATTHWWFHQNQITYVPASYFQGVTNLLVITLHENSVNDIADNAFVSVSMVTDIHLYDNNLQVIRRLMFAGLSNLEALYLYRNQIHNIESGSFRYISIATI